MAPSKFHASVAAISCQIAWSAFRSVRALLSAHAADKEILDPFLPLCEALGRIGVSLAPGSSIDRIEVALRGPSELDSRILTTSVLNGVLSGHTEEEVNFVNARSMAEERGIRIEESRALGSPRTSRSSCASRSIGGDTASRSRAPASGREHAPPGVGLRPELQRGVHAVLRLLPLRGPAGDDRPRGHDFGQHGVNIDSAAVGAEPATEAVMAVTADKPVPQELVERDRRDRRLP